MDMDEAFPGKFLKTEDLLAISDEEDEQSAKFIIDAVEWEQMPDGSRKPAVSFSRCSTAEFTRKLFVLNKTNSTRIKEKYGKRSEDWKGKTIEIYATTTDMAGKTVGCLRVRFPKAQGKAANGAPAQSRPPVQADPDDVRTQTGRNPNPAPASGIGSALDDEIPF